MTSEIKVFSSNYRVQLARIPFSLEESGYPPPHVGGILSACTELNTLNYGAPLSGQALRDYLDRTTRQTNDEAERND